MASNYIPQVDYTSRDYAAIRDDMIALIPSILPEWTSTDPSDFGITLIELFAYMGDMLNYYIDRSANEGFITTATQRNSVLSIARMLNYTPSTGTPATASLTFQNSTSSDITVPALTQVATTTTVNGISTQIIFETNTDVVVPAAVGAIKGSAAVTATQGVTIANEYLGDSDGTAYQTFTLSQHPLIAKTSQISANGVIYSEVNYLIDAGYNDPVYTVVTDANNISSINFGDNISGRIPPSGAIYATYRVGGGLSGNVGPNTLTYLLSNITAGLTVNNQLAATGGADPESTDSIRFNAPFSLTALNRAVSLSDYAALSVQVPSVSKAIADGSVYNNILLYMAPYGDTSFGTPGLDATGATSARFTAAYSDLLAFLTDKAPATTTVTILPPKYVPINININLHISDQYRQTTVNNAVYSVLQSILDFDNVIFAEQFVLQYVLSAIATVSGVSYADVTLLARADAAFTGDITSGSPTINNVSSFLNVAVGQQVALQAGSTSTTTITPGTTISSFDSVARTITLSANAAGTGSATGASLWTSSVSTTGINNVQCATNEIPKAGVITITPIGGIVS
jgi:Baseplate J-like protein